MTDLLRSPTGAPELRLMSARRSVPAHLREISRFRELIVMLTRKELTVRYQHSVLGFTWSMIQPLFLLVVYTVVFAILGAGFARFAIWVLCGLLVWTLVSTALLTATQSITSNASLVGKVKFPRAVLPLSSVGAALVHFCLQSIAFAVVLVVTRHPVDWSYMWLLPIAARHLPHRVRRARPPARPAQRLRPRHDAPARAARARLVLGHADPVPVRAGRRLVRATTGSASGCCWSTRPRRS